MANYIVGLTGGIGCGKTTVSDLFQALGVPKATPPEPRQTADGRLDLVNLSL